MSATAMKNMVRRREHQERAQPANRSRFGLLEKHKDYVARARAFHDKERRITSMKRRAAFRNPDEFYFGMTKAATKDGVHTKSEDAPALTGDELKLLKTQDSAYLHTVLTTEQKKIEKLRSSLHILPAVAAAAAPSAAPKHTIFVDTPEEVAAFDPATHFDTDASMLPRTFNRPRITAAAAAAVAGGSDRTMTLAEAATSDMDVAASRGATMDDMAAVDERTRKRVRAAAEAAYSELDARLERSKKFARVAASLDLQRHLMQKGRRRKVVAATPDAAAVYEWKQERKR